MTADFACATLGPQTLTRISAALTAGAAMAIR
jgi:hypothetical protein